jgi:hypothetical protein
MSGSLRDEPSGAGRGAARYALLGAALGLLLIAAAAYLFAHVRRPAPVVETVTTGARAAQAAAAPAPVYFAPQLPARDAELEQAGDRIAEVEVYLKKRQRDAALAALGRARRATARALEARQRKGSHHDALAAALRELDAAEHSIERGAYDDAHRRLAALDESLDLPDF